MMKKTIAILAAFSVAILTACGSKTDANEKNFSAAMSQYFEKKGDLCLNTRRWPIELSEMDLRLQKSMQTGTANQMAVLEAAGLVKSLDTEVDVIGIIGKPTGAKAKIKRYTLTEAARPYTQDIEGPPKSIESTEGKKVALCWGKKALDRIVKWEGPMKFGDYQEAGITYTYKVDNLADWAKAPDIQATFPAVKSILDGVGNKEIKHAIKLTSLGWEAKGLD